MPSEKYLQNIRSQPSEWQKCLEHSFGAGLEEIEKAAVLLRKSRKVVVSGIGASFNAGLAVVELFRKAGLKTVFLEDSSELMASFTEASAAKPSFFLDKKDALVLLSRSGKSLEIVRLLDAAAEKKVPVVGIGNDPRSPLGERADHFLAMHVAFDHSISVATFSAIIAVAAVVSEVLKKKKPSASFQKRAFSAIEKIEKWLEKGSSERAIRAWMRPDDRFCFLARGASQAASKNANLLWEEAAKTPAASKSTGAFRHGPQESVGEKTSFLIWIDPDSASFEHDLALARDLKTIGAAVLTIGADGRRSRQTARHETESRASVVLPSVGWPFSLLAEQIPAQLAAFELAEMTGADADVFRFCDFVVESEGGIF